PHDPRHPHPFPTRRSSDLAARAARHAVGEPEPAPPQPPSIARLDEALNIKGPGVQGPLPDPPAKPSQMYGGFWRRFFALLIDTIDRKSTRLNSSHDQISYA